MNIISQQMTLFGKSSVMDNNIENKESKIFVSKMSYLSSSEENRDDLFSGYDEFFCITYSYGLPEITHIMSFFEKGEILIGCANMVSFSLAELIARQNYVINECNKNAYLASRIEKNELRIFVLDGMVSHEKIYLLKKVAGGFRTILASANFSGSAWNGKQRENIVVCDDEECFNVYMKRFNILKESCSPVVKNALVLGNDGENIEETPVIKKARREGVLVIDVSNQTKEMVEYDYYLVNKTPEIKKFLAKGNIRNNGKNVIEITTEKINKIITESKKEQTASIERKDILPQFIIDYNENIVSLNGEKWDLNPEESDIFHDIELLKQYMSGFNNKFFIGEINKLREIYWKTLNYMFISPFFAKIRHEIGNDDWLRYCPIYLLISGSTDAGKTAFVKLVRKMMFGTRYSKALLQNKFFSTEQSANIKINGKGFPAIIDEITSAQWAQASNIVKNDASLIDDHHMNHPCFILIANELNGVRPEISKRVMVFNPNCRMPRDLAMKNGGIVKEIGNKMGTALYKEYVRMMLEQLPDFISNIISKKAIPDVWLLSSSILRSIFDRFNAFPEFKTQTWQDYVGEKTICDKAITLLLNEYSNNPDIFKVQRNANKLFVDFSTYDANEMQAIIKTLIRELPTVFSCKKLTASKIILDLKAVEDFTGKKFSTNGFKNFCKKFFTTH